MCQGLSAAAEPTAAVALPPVATAAAADARLTRSSVLRGATSLQCAEHRWHQAKRSMVDACAAASGGVRRPPPDPSAAVASAAALLPLDDLRAALPCLAMAVGWVGDILPSQALQYCAQLRPAHSFEARRLRHCFAEDAAALAGAVVPKPADHEAKAPWQLKAARTKPRPVAAANAGAAGAVRLARPAYQGAAAVPDAGMAATAQPARTALHC